MVNLMAPNLNLLSEKNSFFVLFSCQLFAALELPHFDSSLGVEFSEPVNGHFAAESIRDVKSPLRETHS